GLAQARGLELPRLSDPLVARLRASLPPAADCANPIDLAGGGEQDLGSFSRVARLLLASGEVDGVLLTGYFGGYGEYGEGPAREEQREAGALGGVADASGRPLLVHTMYPDAPAAGVLRDAGVPVFGAIERAVAVLGRLHAHRAQGPSGVPALPPAAPPVPQAGYDAVRDLLAAAGVPFAAARTVATLEEALAAARELGFPVVLKALGLLHKSDAGGVVLGLADPGALARAFADLQERLAPTALSVERQAPAEGVELLVGTRWDARFGPVALVGLGGVYTEVLRDVAVALAPVEADEARRLLLSLRAAPLLRGARGRAAVDLGAAAEAVAALSRMAAAHPELAELEVNPLRVTPRGALGLDARAVLAEQ
ncbi:MAG: acetate--CoA ligase family protein, partial [Actinomycetota bacterium]|nr:acetate--CoA ligase family protein [Actinomycetota bacterium]